MLFNDVIKNMYRMLMVIQFLLVLFFFDLVMETNGNNLKPVPMEVTINNHGNLTLEQLIKLKKAGATSIQRYIHWKDIEKTPGEYDWSSYDAELELVRKAGLKWVPFVIAGPHYVTPEFARQDKDITFYQCLEHGKEDLIPSIWCPRFPKYIDGWLQAFADHYVKTGLLESVQLGITGGYGEAIYPADIGRFPVTMHAHSGFWCGDKYAVDDFKQHCKNIYQNDISNLNSDWGTYYPNFDVIKPFTREYSPSPKAWLTFMAWYRQSMTDHAEWWLQTAKKYFGDTPLYICTGGNMTLEHGTDFFAQAKMAANYNAGARVTNENVWLPKNIFLTRMLGSAANFYGSFWGSEPASYETPAGSVGRIFNLHTFGASQMFVYHIRTDKMEQAFTRHANFLTQQQSKPDLAVFYPTTTMALEYRYGALVSRPFYYRVRECIDYAFVDEQMVRDGALDQHQVLLVYETDYAPKDVIETLRNWVENGGILISINSRVADLNQNTEVWDALSGLTESSDLHHTGIHGRNLEILKPEILPSFKAISSETRNGISHVNPSSQILMRMKPYPECIQAWLYSSGKGKVIAYQGSPNNDGTPGLPLRDDQVTREEDYQSSESHPVLFLKDSLAYIHNEKMIQKGLPTLWLGDRSIFLSNLVSGDLVAINVGKVEKTFTHNGKHFVIPSETIIQVQSKTK